MRVIVLPEDLYTYLCYVVDSYARRGIDPREGLSLYHLHRAVGDPPQVDERQVAKLAVGGDGNASLSVEPRQPHKIVDDSGSTVCATSTCTSGGPSEELNSGDLIGQLGGKFYENERARKAGSLETQPPPPASS